MSQVAVTMTVRRTNELDRAIDLLEKANADLDPEGLTLAQAKKLLASYARAEKLASFGVAALARKIDDAEQVAKLAGTSMGKAKAVVTTGKVLSQSHDLSKAMARGKVSLDQASEIASAEQSAPGAARDLLKVAASQSFHALKDQARATKLEAEQHGGLAERQHRARSARSYGDDLGMTHIHLSFEPHIATPLVARAEAEANRLFKKAKAEAKARLAERNGRAVKEELGLEPFERYLADAYAALLSGNGKPRAKRPELVVLVSHEIAKRGWKDVRPGEVCKIPGVGPVAPQVAKEIANDAFLSGVFYDGEDLRHIKRWSRSIPVEVQVALELGEPPQFDGVKCVDCGNRFRSQFDHVEPVSAGGPTALWNFKDRCPPCHWEKTKKDMEAMRAERAKQGRSSTRGKLKKPAEKDGRSRRRQRSLIPRAGPPDT